MQGAGVKKTRSVFSPRARTPAGGRSRCVFAKRTRGFSAQSPSQEQTRCRSHCSLPCPASTQSETLFPDGSPGGKRVPESALRLGRSFRMAPQAETATRNRGVEWDMLSQWQPRRKIYPGIPPQTGMRFPDDASSGKSIPEFAPRTGHAFRMAPQAETATRNLS